MTLSRRLVALACLAYGLLMVLGGSDVYTSTTYSVVFDLARDVSPDSVPPTTVWGVGFVVAGIAALIPARGDGDLVGFVILEVVLAAWAIGLWAAVLTGEAETWGGPVWPTALAALALANAGRRTIR